MTSIRISAWAIRDPIPVSVLFIGLLLAGALAYLRLPVKALPDTSFPIVAVNVIQTGAAPSELEGEVTQPVENAVAGIAGVKNVFSSVSLGASVTTVEFEIGEDEQRATDQVRAAVDRIRADLPRAIEQAIVERVDVDAFPVATYAVASDRLTEVELSWLVDDRIARRLQGLPGVSSVRRFGGVAREINVTLDPARMAAHDVTAPAINEALRDVLVDAPGGRAEVGGAEQNIRILAATPRIEALRGLAVPTSAGRYVRLGDIASIGDGAGEVRRIARLDGRPVIGFEVLKTKAASDVRVSAAIADALPGIEAATPGLDVTLISSGAAETASEFDATVTVLWEGMLLAALVVWVFLRSWRSTIIAALAMPVSLIPTFAVMDALGFSLNMVTLLALTLVIGILVDDAIVEIENIEKRIERGEDPYSAALHGADEIGLAVMAITLAIVVVFVPVSFMGGVVGRYFREFGLTVAVAVLFSLLVARLLTPLLAAYFLSPARKPQARKPFAGWYARTLEASLAHPKLSVLSGIGIFAGSLWLATQIPSGFLPTGNPRAHVMGIEAPAGMSIEDMDTAVAQASHVLGQHPDVERVFANVDGAAGSLTVVFRKQRNGTIDQFERRVQPALDAIPGVRVTGRGADGAAAEFELTLTGRDGPQLDLALERVRTEMAALPGFSGVRLAAPPPVADLVIRPRTEDAARLGVSTLAIADAARVATIGDVDANVAKLPAGERRIPIRVQLPREARADLDTIAALELPTAAGPFTRLDAVADITFEPGPTTIERFGRARRGAIRAQLDGLTLGQALEQVNALPSLRNLPAGVTQADLGEAEQFNELFGGFVGAMLAGVGMIFAVLILLFRSFFKPLTILAALPLAIGGAFAGLLIAGLALTLPAMIGILMLLGLAAKNSILLVEFAIERERDGMRRHDAIVEACRERARPIVMTTVAMAAGMLPTALAFSSGAEFRQPMAVAVIGGLISSTALTLVLVPAVHELIETFENWLTPKLAHVVTPASREAAARDALRSKSVQ
jgi:HAE1 family hydrophobic/amphiphilic exporter-1